jgi:hypothetical protein
MKIKTSELKGAALDWAVAKCEGLKLGGLPYNPSSNWKYGGPIIEREQIFVKPTAKLAKGWRTYQRDPAGNGICNSQYGPTPLIAAMRCYVASKLGDEVDVPDELND